MDGFFLGGFGQGMRAAQDAENQNRSIDLAERAQGFNEKYKTAELGIQNQRLVIEDKKQLREMVNQLQAGIKDSATVVNQILEKNPANVAATQFWLDRIDSYAMSLEQIGAAREAADARAQGQKIRSSVGEYAPAAIAGAGIAGQAEAVKATAQAKGELEGGLGVFQGQKEAQKIEAETPAKVAQAGQIAGAQAAEQLPFQIRLHQAQKAIDAAAASNTKPDTFKQANILRDEFTGLTKDFRTVGDAYNKIKGATDNGAGDMSMLYSFVKLLDPTSVVRESEFATAAASGSLGQRMQGAVNRVLSGERLPASLREDFQKEADKIYKGQKVQFDSVKKKYTGLAERYKIPVEDVVIDTSDPLGLR